MHVEIGNASALDARDENGQKDYFKVSGARTTIVQVPDGVGVSEAFQSITDALAYHIQPGSAPVWIESDNSALRDLLLDHYDIDPSDNIRPVDWGREPET